MSSETTSKRRTSPGPRAQFIAACRQAAIAAERFLRSKRYRRTDRSRWRHPVALARELGRQIALLREMSAHPPENRPLPPRRGPFSLSSLDALTPSVSDAPDDS